MSDKIENTPNLIAPNVEFMEELASASSKGSVEKTQKNQEGSAVFSDQLTVAENTKGATTLVGNYKTTDLEADEPQVPASSLEEGAAVEDGTESISSTGKWLTLSAKSVVAEEMIKMASILRQARVVETKLRINNLTILFELAQNAADLILDTAKKQADIYKEQAQMAMIKAVAGAASFAMGGAAMYSGARANPATPEGRAHQGFASAWTTGGMGQAMNTTATSSADMMGNTAIARLTREKGKLEASKEIVDSIKSILQQSLQSAFDNDKKLEDLLKSSLQRAQQIYQQEARAHSSLTQHSV